MMHSGKYRTDPTDSPIMLAIDDGVSITIGIAGFSSRAVLFRVGEPVAIDVFIAGITNSIFVEVILFRIGYVWAVV